MSNLIAATIEVSLDEPCFYLREVNLQSPDFHGWHRYQLLTVVRYEKFAEYIEDLGPRELYPTSDQFGIPGGVVDQQTQHVEILHTVGELRDIADVLRGERSRALDISPSDLVKGYRDAMEQRPLRRRAVSSFGPIYNKIRSSYDH